MKDLKINIIGDFIKEFEELDELDIYSVYSSGMVGSIRTEFNSNRGCVPIDKIDYLYNSQVNLFSIGLNIKDVYMSLNEDELKKALYLAYRVEKKVKELVNDFIVKCEYYEKFKNVCNCNSEIKNMFSKLFNNKPCFILNNYMRNALINAIHSIDNNITQLACLDDETFNMLVDMLRKNELDGVNRYMRFNHPSISYIKYYRVDDNDKGIFDKVKEEYELLVELSKKFRSDVE